MSAVKLNAWVLACPYIDRANAESGRHAGIAILGARQQQRGRGGRGGDGGGVRVGV